MIRIDYFLLVFEISNKYIFKITTENTTRLVTNSTEFVSEKNLKNRPENIYNKLLSLWDITNREWFIWDFKNNTTRIDWGSFENLGGIQFVYEMPLVEDFDLINEHNRVQLDNFKIKDKKVNDILLDLSKKYNLNLDHSDYTYFKTLYHADGIAEEDIRFCALLESKIEELTDENIDHIKNKWINFIFLHSCKVKDELKSEIEYLDKSDPGYEYEVEEINTIIKLIDNSVDEFKDELASITKTDKVFDEFPPLLMPCPYEIDASVFNRVLARHNKDND